jgi:hypothetical protein
LMSKKIEIGGEVSSGFTSPAVVYELAAAANLSTDCAPCSVNRVFKRPMVGGDWKWRMICSGLGAQVCADYGLNVHENSAAPVQICQQG